MKLLPLRTIMFAAVAAVFATSAFAMEEESSHGDMQRGGKGKGFERMMERMREMDANKDGFIDKDEYMKNAEKKWVKMDKEGKGKVSLAEFEEKHKKRMEERKERMKEHGGGDHGDHGDATKKE